MYAQWHIVDAFVICESQACKFFNLPNLLTKSTKVLDDQQCSDDYMMPVPDGTQHLDFGLQLQAT